MSSTEPDSYIRGAGGIHADGRRVAATLLALLALVLGVLAVVFTVIAAHHNSRATSLRDKGMPVVVTVTGCVGLASGTGITEAGFTCKGSYALNGQRYVETIGGNSNFFEVGQHVAGIAVRDDPTVVYAASWVARTRATWTVYLTPAALFLALVAALWLLQRITRRRRVRADVGSA